MSDNDEILVNTAWPSSVYIGIVAFQACLVLAALYACIYGSFSSDENTTDAEEGLVPPPIEETPPLEGKRSSTILHFSDGKTMEVFDEPVERQMNNSNSGIPYAESAIKQDAKQRRKKLMKKMKKLIYLKPKMKDAALWPYATDGVPTLDSSSEKALIRRVRERIWKIKMPKATKKLQEMGHDFIEWLRERVIGAACS
ncbi:hypothetical protein CAPTEDRAFT_201924 [Capitella teleta]|uniref:Uncharacterized protein n=1 Tax=Capitella teleta TaxID=283909 RepID=R7TIJ3_CAPTE|nr:hypothetical protein CAPTEDRAFT_201924 [Capitella teleta]|eukprot:ELT91346.1 hypothetical protein CAPTEDRAFT_201924 [Capitella teleta]